MRHGRGKYARVIHGERGQERWLTRVPLPSLLSNHCENPKRTFRPPPGPSPAQLKFGHACPPNPGGLGCVGWSRSRTAPQASIASSRESTLVPGFSMARRVNTSPRVTLFPSRYTVVLFRRGAKISSNEGPTSEHRAGARAGARGAGVAVDDRGWGGGEVDAVDVCVSVVVVQWPVALPIQCAQSHAVVTDAGGSCTVHTASSDTRDCAAKCVVPWVVVSATVSLPTSAAVRSRCANRDAKARMPLPQCGGGSTPLTTH
jgi:hypothetical protein